MADQKSELCVLIVAANHSFRQNAEFQPFNFHPVLGFITAIVAVKDISKGSEVEDKYFVFLICAKHLFNQRFSVTMITILNNMKQWVFSVGILNAPW